MELTCYVSATRFQEEASISPHSGVLHRQREVGLQYEAECKPLLRSGQVPNYQLKFLQTTVELETT